MTAREPGSKRRRAYRAPTGLPRARDNWRMGSVASVLIHVAIAALLLERLASHGLVSEFPQGAGGPGPAGGGGGGNRGTGGPREVVQFVRVAEPLPTPAPVTKAVQPPPVLPPLPQPSALERPQLTPPKLSEPLLPIGSGGGTGTDQTSGTGPGSGGGVGSGIGQGRGSGVGPGTGGGNQANFPPTPTDIFIPPLPTPASVKGHHLVAEFDVDANGKVLSITFNETRDGGYNRRLREVLKGFRFRPGTTPDGTPIRMKAQIVVDLY